MFNTQLTLAANQLLERAQAHRKTVATAESCTGGLIAALLTAVPGSSALLERGFVTYSNHAKIELLHVAEALVERYGAVSEPVARAMAEGAIWHSQADVSIAVTGVAGPGGGSQDKPVGLVHLATARRQGETVHQLCHFDGDREMIRLAAVAEALIMLEAALGTPDS